MLMKEHYGISQWPDEKEIYEKMDRLVREPLHPIKPEAMQRYLRYFDEKCQGSHAMIEEAKKVIPGGVQHNLAFNYPFPLVITKAEGAYLYDIDGNRYVDYLQAGGPTLLGSNYEPVNRKVWEVVRESGPVTGLFHPYEMKLAEKIRECMPWVEMYRCLASGTEADMVAIRIARTYTGKERIVKVGGAYHGGATSWSTPSTSPIPRPSRPTASPRTSAPTPGSSSPGMWRACGGCWRRTRSTAAPPRCSSSPSARRAAPARWPWTSPPR